MITWNSCMKWFNDHEMTANSLQLKRISCRKFLAKEYLSQFLSHGPGPQPSQNGPTLNLLPNTKIPNFPNATNQNSELSTNSFSWLHMNPILKTPFCNKIVLENPKIYRPPWLLVSSVTQTTFQFPSPDQEPHALKVSVFYSIFLFVVHDFLRLSPFILNSFILS